LCIEFGVFTIKRLKELEAENRKLKQMFAELSLKSQLQEEIIKKL
jgi:putative transposase